MDIDECNCDHTEYFDKEYNTQHLILYEREVTAKESIAVTQEHILEYLELFYKLGVAFKEMLIK